MKADRREKGAGAIGSGAVAGEERGREEKGRKKKNGKGLQLPPMGLAAAAPKDGEKSLGLGFFSLGFFSVFFFVPIFLLKMHSIYRVFYW